MICLSVKRISINEKQNHSMQSNFKAKNRVLYYKISFQNAEMAATHLHAFKVIRNGEEFYLPTHMLKSGDNIWIDQSAFMADGSFTLTKKECQCLPGNTKILTPIENIVSTKEVIHFQVGTVTIQASCSHPLVIMRDNHSVYLRADELRAGDMLVTDVSLLSPGNKVLGSDGKLHKVKKICKGKFYE